MIKPVIRLWLLPVMEQSQLKKLLDDIARKVAGIKEFGLKDTEVTCIDERERGFLNLGRGEEILIDATVFEGEDKTVLERLGHTLVGAITAVFPNAFVECSVGPAGSEQMIITNHPECYPMAPPI